MRLLCEHVDQYGTGLAGELFLTYRGGTYQPSTLWQVLRKARVKAFAPAQVASPLARRPYDFRHAGISWRLNAGTPGPQVAEWAGLSVEVLYRIYAHCLEGRTSGGTIGWRKLLARAKPPAGVPGLPDFRGLSWVNASIFIPCAYLRNDDIAWLSRHYPSTAVQPRLRVFVQLRWYFAWL